jgi:hypothetical protein
LKKALEKGYVVQRIYEVWHFEETEQYDPKTKTGGLFTDYVKSRIWSLVNMSKYSASSDMYFIRGMLDLCPNFPQKLFSISLANALNQGFFFMSL